MIKLSFNLPTKYRLDINLVKRRGTPSEKPLLSKLESVSRVKKGNKLSRFFRYMFEYKNIRKIFGANLAIIITASTLIPLNVNGAIAKSNININHEESVVLTTKRGIQYPLEKIIITQGYKIYHPAIDLDGITGDIVRPIMGGRVVYTKYSPIGYGNVILIDHGDNITSLYAHLSKFNVKKGQEVFLDTKIGEVGSTGHSFGDHLHLEIRDHGIPINPLSVLPPHR